MSKLAVVILAAGKGERMQSPLPKVMHKIAGLEMVRHVTLLANHLKAEKTVVVIGEDMEDVKQAVHPADTVVQSPPRGTGDALKQAYDKYLKKFDGTVLVMFGDTPLISLATCQSLIRTLESVTDPAVAVLGFNTANPAQYGRLITSEDREEVFEIVEFKDATPEQANISLCNSGVMAFDGKRLGTLLDKLEDDNAAGEFYLTDCIKHAREESWQCRLVLGLETEVLGVNTRQDQAVAEHIAQNSMRALALMNGVTMMDPNTVYFSYDTELAANVTLEPNVFFGLGVTVEDNVTIRAFSHIEQATLKQGCTVGPFARIRPGTTVGEEARVGNFVEVKNAQLAKGVKINHLSYVGDATVGANSNIGAGTIFCNYDGFQKSQTTIGDNVFVGSNSSLVAPVTIGNDAIVGAGSVITENVAKNALGLSRADQTQVDNWAEKYRKKKAS